MLNNLTTDFQSKLDSTINYPVNLAVLYLDTTTLYLSDIPIILDTTGFEGVEFKPQIESWNELDDNVQYDTDFIGDTGTLQSRTAELDLIYNSDSAPIFEDIFRRNIKINKKKLHLYQQFLNSTEPPVLMDIFSCTSKVEYIEKEMKFTIELDSVIMDSDPLLQEPLEGKSLKGVQGRVDYIPLKDNQSSPVSEITQDLTSTYTGLVTISNGIGFLDSDYILLNNEYIRYSSISATTIYIEERGCSFESENLYSEPENHISGSKFFQKGAVFEYDVCRGPLATVDSLRVLGTDNNYYDYAGDSTIVYDTDPVKVLFSNRKPQLVREAVGGPTVAKRDHLHFNSYDNGDDVINPNGSIVSGGEFQLQNVQATEIGTVYTKQRPSWKTDFLPAQYSHLETEGDVGFSENSASLSIYPVQDPPYNGQKAATLYGSHIDSYYGYGSLPVTLSSTARVIPYSGISNIFNRTIYLGFDEAFAQYMNFTLNIYLAVSTDGGSTYGDYINIFTRDLNYISSSYSDITELKDQLFQLNLYPTYLSSPSDYIKVKFETVVTDYNPAYSAASLGINTLGEGPDALYFNQGAMDKVSYSDTLDEIVPETKTFYVNFDKDLSYLGEFTSARLLSYMNAPLDEDYDSTTLLYYQNNDEWNLYYSNVFDSGEVKVFSEILSDITSQENLRDLRLKYEYIPDPDAPQPAPGETETCTLTVGVPRILLSYDGYNLDESNYQYADNLTVRGTSNLYPVTPPDLIKDITLNKSDIGAYLDTTNFDERSYIYDYFGYYMNGLVDDDIHYHEALKLIMTEGLCRLRYNQGKIQCYDLYKYLDQTIDYEYPENIVDMKSRNQYDLTDRKIANNIVINYNKDNLKNVYNGVYTGSDTTSISSNGRVDFNKDYNFITTEAAAQQISNFILAQRYDYIFGSEFESYLHSYRIEKGDTLIVEYKGGQQQIKVQNVLRVFQSGVNEEINIFKIQGIQRYIATMGDQKHNDSQDKQGGMTGQYYHLTQSQYEAWRDNLTSILSHVSDTTSNPHEVTKTQIGLGNVDNTSDVNKPISTATQTALDAKLDATAADQIQSDVTTLQNDVSQLQSDMTIAQSDITTLKSDSTTLQGNVSQLQSDMTVVQSDIINLDTNTDLQKVYNNSSHPELVLDSDKSNAGLSINDDATAISGNLFEIQNNTGSSKYFEVDSSEIKAYETTLNPLQDSTSTTLHYHDSDRDRSNHSGTQTASTISDFDTEVSNNSDVSANTTHRTSNGSDHTYIDQNVTSGSSPTFNNTNISATTDKNYVTDAEKTVIGNTSGINTGDQTSGDFDHGQLQGLSDDDHSQYSLLNGRSGGQTLYGGTSSGDDLNLRSTSNATKGNINLGTESTYDEVNDRLGIGLTDPDTKIHVKGTTNDDSASSLKIDNSDDYELLSIRNDGDAFISPDFSSPSLAIGTNQAGIGLTGLSISGQYPSIAIDIKRASGGAAASFFTGHLSNTSTSLSSEAGGIGVFGTMESGSTPPTIYYMYLGAGETSYNNAAMRIYPDKSVLFADDISMGGMFSPSARLHIKGATDTSSSTALKVANSSNDSLFTVRSDGLSTFTGVTIQGTFSSAPTGVEGGIYYNSTDNHFYGHNGTSWVQLDN